ncbi:MULTISPECIES: hypothetical protein [Streptomyces]|uniref:Uncharacterized protein n=2 Tax=Streptomyces TaxID=1883 RepID=A0ABU2RUP2_9ACTN|nr:MULTISPECIES: hypothetical protein [unclassified Streptomyces]MBK3595410.1 hypothetical protein [Streptomyces sp. MBT51]MDT0432552.1 hypothetical protein [Streptomyces sp. DSM 41770]HBF83836.1 hypothetical protein [Streptomyces sp.]
MRGKLRRGGRGRLAPQQIGVKLAIPFVGEISGVWEPVEAEREAAWELYVELATRISVVELREDEGLLREALSSLYTVFGTTREILRRYGPAVAPRVAPGQVTFGLLAVNVLNLSIRPLLSRWHPLLTAYEVQREDRVDPVAHERSWDRAPELRAEIESVRQVLLALAQALNKVAGVGDLITVDVPAQTREPGRA